jgi:hypothetical protein
MSVFSDFDWSWRGVRVRETGAEIAFTPALALDVWRGGYYILRERLRRPASELPLKIGFEPRAPRPWYLLWGVLRQSGLTQAAKPEEPADITLHFSDLTRVDGPPPDGSTLNGLCTDISKSHVAQTFQAVFGYDLSLDPCTANGPFLEKGEENGVHDGQIHHAPTAARPGRVYQKLIDNKTKDGTVLDYRCPTVFGNMPLVFLKERPVDQRFANLNTRVRMADPRDCFSAEELTQIKTFCAAMQLDWGGLDILRDADDGRIYIVDVNKTDMGPPLALPIKYKLSAVKILGQALRTSLMERLS